MRTYHKRIKKGEIEFLGPTKFAPVIRKAIKIAKIEQEIKTSRYQVLLILTDGEILDMPETLDCLAEISKSNLPLSLIIVGVGEEDFTNMVKLDGDHTAVRRGVKDLV